MATRIAGLLSRTFCGKSSSSSFAPSGWTQVSRASLISTSRTERRFCADSSSENNHAAELDGINSKFAEAREEIEIAMESKETVYFDEEAQAARDAVKLVLDKYHSLLSKMSEEDKGAVQRSMGLKMEQLKAELEQLDA